MNKRMYAFLLDFMPLVEEITQENRMLGETLQYVGLQALLGECRFGKLRILLRLARDLGYTSPEIIQYLERELTRVSRSVPQRPLSEW
ncbi:MAG: hypothetical protein OXR66_02425 [Candidatus Woesearchaeota archaeon]|nr:hypothetical protein [Candidatus Woesearchaeota archaeon]